MRQLSRYSAGKRAPKFFLLAYDHEKGVPVNTEPPQSATESTKEASVPSSSNGGGHAPSAAAPTPLSGLARLRDTPKRRSLREAVTKTIGGWERYTFITYACFIVSFLESVNNSPKVALPPRREPREISSRLLSAGGVHKLALAASGGSKGSPAAVRRWHDAVKKAVTPDVLKRAREIRRQQQQQQQHSSDGVGDRLANSSTASSRQVFENGLFTEQAIHVRLSF